jgi:hypothetical protein
MRASRAGWASVGAGTILVLIGALILAVVSTVVAFQGWPGASGPQSAAEPTALLAAAATAAGVATDSELTGADVRVPAARRPPTAASSRPARTTESERSRGAAPQRASVVEPAASPVVREPASADTSPAGTPAPATPVQESLDSTADTVRRTGDALGGTLGGTVGGLGEATTPVSPTLGQVVEDVGTVVDDTVQGVTDSLGVVIESLSGG